MRVRPFALVVLALGALAGCGGSVKILTCPLGTLPEGDHCVAIQPTDTLDSDTTPPSDTAPPADTAPPDTAADTLVATDAPPADTATGPAGTGAACVKNADCAGGTCLDWSDGYCTALGCDAATCPDGAACIPVEAGNHVCLATCFTDADCRPGTQACKPLREGASGIVHRVCVGVDANAGATGAACTDATHCAGAADCLASFPGGYCGAIGCTATSCPGDARCVPVDGEPTCLRACAQDVDCGGAAGAERRCGVLDEIGGGTASVCISGVAERPIGQPCLSDFECSSGRCEILGEGRCSQTSGPCFIASTASDCNGAESCFVSADSRSGVCTRPCGPGAASCPDGSFCVADGGSTTAGACRVVCSQGGHECDAVSGMACRFGIPLSEGAQGRYACRRERPRGFAAPCSNAADCRSGSCLQAAAGSPGTCTEPCVGDGYCPFPGSCVNGTPALCYPACFSEADCVAGFSCGLTTGSSRQVCAP